MAQKLEFKVTRQLLKKMGACQNANDWFEDLILERRKGQTLSITPKNIRKLGDRLMGFYGSSPHYSPHLKFYPDWIIQYLYILALKGELHDGKALSDQDEVIGEINPIEDLEKEMKKRGLPY